MKQIQIPEQLFMELVKFHLLDMEENLPSIKQGLEAQAAGQEAKGEQPGPEGTQ